MAELDGIVGTKPVPAGIDVEEFSNGIAKLVGGPLRVVRTALVDVTDGDALHVGLGEKVEHDAQALSADTDESDIDFVARRDIAGPAEYTAGNDGEADSGGGGVLDEFAARD